MSGGYQGLSDAAERRVRRLLHPSEVTLEGAFNASDGSEAFPEHSMVMSGDYGRREIKPGRLIASLGW